MTPALLILASVSYANHFHQEDCEVAPPISARRAIADWEKGRLPTSGLNVRGALQIVGGGRAFRCDHCCFDALSFTGEFASIELRSSYFRGEMTSAKGSAVAGTLSILDSRFRGGIRLQDSYVRETNLDRIDMLGGGIRIDHLAGESLSLSEVQSASEDPVALAIGVAGFRSCQLHGLSLSNDLSIDLVNAPALQVSGRIDDDFSVVTSSGGRLDIIDLSGLVVGGRVGLILQVVPQEMLFSEADLGDQVVIRKSPGTHGESRLDLSRFSGRFREVPPAGVLVPWVRLGTPESELRASLVRLARSYEELGMTRSSLAIRAAVARSDISDAAGFEKVPAFARWLGSGKGADVRILIAWACLAVGSVVGQATVQFWSLRSSNGTRPSVAPEDFDPADQTSFRTHMGRAIVAGMNSILPAPADHGMMLEPWAVFVHFGAQFFVWMLVALFAGTLAGYF